MNAPLQTQPSWVLIDGVLSPVSAFAGLPPSARPDARCSLCQEPVILKLGVRRVHHYAHQPDSRCRASHPETALHLNTKCYLYEQLRTAQQVLVERFCTRFVCRKRDLLIWQEDWDQVEIEFAMTGLRPDIALLKEGRVIAAIEVVVTHAIDEQKKQRLAEAAIPWVEVTATEALSTGEDRWTSDHALPVARSSGFTRQWRCDSCRARTTPATPPVDRQPWRSEHIYAAKMVDMYFPSGKQYREVFFVVKAYQDDACVKVKVRTERGKVLATEQGDISEAVLTRLNAAVQRYVQEHQQRGALIAHRIPWRRWEKGQRFMARATDRWPFRYTWNAISRQWEWRD